MTKLSGWLRHWFYTFQASWHTARQKIFLSMLKNFVRIRTFLYALYDKHTLDSRHTLNTPEVRQMYGTHTLAFQRIFVRMKIISLIFIRFSYVSLIRNSVTGPLSKLKIMF